MHPAPLDESDRGNVNGHVHDEVATTNQRLKHLAEILAGQGLLHEADAVFLRFLATDIVSRDDRDPFGSQPANVPQDQRQHSLADATEADDDQPAGKGNVDFVLRGRRA